MQALFKIIICCFFLLFSSAAVVAEPGRIYTSTAQRLLEHVKYQEPVENELAALRLAETEMLYRQLDTDQKKKAFWINIFNSLATIELRQNPQLYADRKKFFSRKIFALADRSFSLDDIEHSLLRRSEPGFLPRFLRPLFMSPFTRRLSVRELDPRIHFALNCTARSCPPILFYDADKLDTQLDLATLNYLRASVHYDPAANRIELPAIFSWYAGDFGEEQGIAGLLKKYGITGHGVSPAFTYKPWDWSPEPGKFQ